MKDIIFANLADKFGHEVGLRIYECAVVLADEKEIEDMHEAIGRTIGMLKMIKRRFAGAVDGAEGTLGRFAGVADSGHYKGRPMTWAQACDDLEARQMRTRRTIDKVSVSMEAREDAGKILEADGLTTEERTDVTVWVENYLTNLTPRRRGWIMNVLNGYRRGNELKEATRKNVSKYAPDGVKPVEFVELLARYA